MGCRGVQSCPARQADVQCLSPGGYEQRYPLCCHSGGGAVLQNSRAWQGQTHCQGPCAHGGVTISGEPERGTADQNSLGPGLDSGFFVCLGVCLRPRRPRDGCAPALFSIPRLASVGLRLVGRFGLAGRDLARVLFVRTDTPPASQATALLSCQSAPSLPGRRGNLIITQMPFSYSCYRGSEGKVKRPGAQGRQSREGKRVPEGGRAAWLLLWPGRPEPTCGASLPQWPCCQPFPPPSMELGPTWEQVACTGLRSAGWPLHSAQGGGGSSATLWASLVLEGECQAASLGSGLMPEKRGSKGFGEVRWGLCKTHAGRGAHVTPTSARGPRSWCGFIILSCF